MVNCSLGPEDAKGLAVGLAANTTLEKVRRLCRGARACVRGG